MSTLRTFMGSAYISAMLASSAAPLRHNAILAATINPQVLQSIANGMGIPMPTPVMTAPPTPIAVAMFSDTPLNNDAYTRLLGFTLNTQGETSIGPIAARLLGLDDTGLGVPVKQISTKRADVKRYFSVSTKPNSDDIVFSIRPDATTLIMYLTNSKLILRAALVVEPGNSYLITNEQAAAGFKALLEFWAEKAKTLPPSTLVNS